MKLYHPALLEKSEINHITENTNGVFVNFDDGDQFTLQECIDAELDALTEAHIKAIEGEIESSQGTSDGLGMRAYGKIAISAIRELKGK